MTKVSLFLDTRRSIKDGSFPIKLRVSQLRKRKYYSTGFYSDKNTFDKLKDINKSLKGEEKIIQDHLIDKLSDARKLIDSMQLFNFRQFEKSIVKGNKTNNNVLDALKSYENELRSQGRVKSANTYLNARNSFIKFLSDDNPKLSFVDIDIEWLNDYEEWMLKNDNSLSTVGIYCRNLRRVYNVAIQTHETALEQFYPFARKRGELNKYVIPQSINRKRALTFDQMQEIIEFDCISESMEKSRDIFVFSYLCQGINLTDIFELKWKDLDNKQISFVRQKIKRRSRANQSKTTIYLADKAIEIIEKWGSTNKAKDNFIFPLYNKKMNEVQKEKSRNLQNSIINKSLKLISQLLELDVTPTFYFARHSYSTIIRNSGAPIEFISEALGHSNIKTTHNYLASFEENQVKKFHTNLTK